MPISQEVSAPTIEYTSTAPVDVPVPPEEFQSTDLTRELSAVIHEAEINSQLAGGINAQEMVLAERYSQGLVNKVRDEYESAEEDVRHAVEAVAGRYAEMLQEVLVCL